MVEVTRVQIISNPIGIIYPWHTFPCFSGWERFNVPPPPQQTHWARLQCLFSDHLLWDADDLVWVKSKGAMISDIVNKSEIFIPHPFLLPPTLLSLSIGLIALAWGYRSPGSQAPLCLVYLRTYFWNLDCDSVKQLKLGQNQSVWIPNISSFHV